MSLINEFNVITISHEKNVKIHENCEASTSLDGEKLLGY